MKMNMGTTCALVRNSLCWGVACQNVWERKGKLWKVLKYFQMGSTMAWLSTESYERSTLTPVCRIDCGNRPYGMPLNLTLANIWQGWIINLGTESVQIIVSLFSGSTDSGKTLEWVKSTCVSLLRGRPSSYSPLYFRCLEEQKFLLSVF